jgi:hypothetical protein
VAEILSAARFLDVATPGAGARVLEAVFDDPDEWFGTASPHGPGTPQYRLIETDLIIVDAAFLSLAEGVTNAKMADVARRGGAALMAKGSAE